MKKLTGKIFTFFILFPVVCNAFTHTIINQTPRRILVKFIYQGDCQSNNRFSPLEIDPDTTRTFETICPLEKIVGSVVVDTSDDTMLRSNAVWRAPKGTFTGKGSWIMSELNDCHILNGFRMCKFEITKVK